MPLQFDIPTDPEEARALFGTLLRTYRQDRGRTLTSTAERVNARRPGNTPVHTSMFGQVESGRRPMPDWLFDLCDISGVLGEKEDIPRLKELWRNTYKTSRKAGPTRGLAARQGAYLGALNTLKEIEEDVLSLRDLPPLTQRLREQITALYKVV